MGGVYKQTREGNIINLLLAGAARNLSHTVFPNLPVGRSTTHPLISIFSSPTSPRFLPQLDHPPFSVSPEASTEEHISCFVLLSINRRISVSLG